LTSTTTNLSHVTLEMQQLPTLYHHRRHHHQRRRLVIVGVVSRPFTSNTTPPEMPECLVTDPTTTRPGDDVIDDQKVGHRFMRPRDIDDKQQCGRLS